MNSRYVDLEGAARFAHRKLQEKSTDLEDPADPLAITSMLMNRDKNELDVLPGFWTKEEALVCGLLIKQNPTNFSTWMNRLRKEFTAVMRFFMTICEGDVPWSSERLWTSKKREGIRHSLSLYSEDLTEVKNHIRRLILEQDRFVDEKEFKELENYFVSVQKDKSNGIRTNIVGEGSVGCVISHPTDKSKVVKRLGFEINIKSFEAKILRNELVEGDVNMFAEAVSNLTELKMNLWLHEDRKFLPNVHLMTRLHVSLDRQKDLNRNTVYGVMPRAGGGDLFDAFGDVLYYHAYNMDLTKDVVLDIISTDFVLIRGGGSGAAQLHERGYCCRDWKADNILLNEDRSALSDLGFGGKLPKDLAALPSKVGVDIGFNDIPSPQVDVLQYIGDYIYRMSRFADKNSIFGVLDELPLSTRLNEIKQGIVSKKMPDYTMKTFMSDPTIWEDPVVLRKCPDGDWDAAYKAAYRHVVDDIRPASREWSTKVPVLQIFYEDGTDISEFPAFHVARMRPAVPAAEPPPPRAAKKTAPRAIPKKGKAVMAPEAIADDDHPPVDAPVRGRGGRGRGRGRVPEMIEADDDLPPVRDRSRRRGGPGRGRGKK